MLSLNQPHFAGSSATDECSSIYYNWKCQSAINVILFKLGLLFDAAQFDENKSDGDET